MVHPKPFLTPHVETPKDIATERAEALSGTLLCHQVHANVHADRCRDIGPKQSYSRFNIRQNVHFCRIINQA